MICCGHLNGKELFIRKKKLNGETKGMKLRDSFKCVLLHAALQGSSRGSRVAMLCVVVLLPCETPAIKAGLRT